MSHGDQQKPHLSIAEMEREIAQTREKLGATIEELAAKADVPGRAKAKASDTAARVRATFRRGHDRTATAPAPAAEAGGTGGALPAAGAEQGAPPPAGAGRPSGRGTPARAKADQVRAKADEARHRAGDMRGKATEKAGHAMERAGHARDRAAGTAHEAAARTGHAAHKVTEDQSRTMYAVAALSLTAATVVALAWAKQHGDFARSGH